MSARTPGTSRTVVKWCAVGVVVAACAGALLVGVGTMQRAAAQSTAVKLVGATPFAVLASGTVTAAGTPSITGDVGGSTVTGLDGRVKGAVSTGGGTAQALADLGTADDTVASSAVTAALSGDVGGTLRPGTYGATGSLDVPGRLVLDAGGDPDAMFIIKTDAAFLTGSATSITLAGGARACNVFWLSSGSATIDGTVVGTVFGRSGITARDGATVTGRLLARSGAVRLDGASMRVPADCDGAPSDKATGTEPVTGADGGPSDPVTDGARSSRSPQTTTAPDRDSGTARGSAAHGSGARTSSAATERSGGTGGDRGNAGAARDTARAGAGGATGGGTSGRSPDATSGRTPAPGGADRRAGEPRSDEPAVDEPGGVPVVTVPGIDPDGEGVGRRVLGVLGRFPRSDASRSDDAASDDAASDDG
jgi:hypothetical protein